MDIKAIAGLYNPADYLLVKELNPWNTDSDKRHVLVVRFADGQELAIKVCRNAFTTLEKVYGWQALCKAYLKLGIYCPQIIDSLKGYAAEAISIGGTEYIVYAEQVKKYKAMDEFEPIPDFEALRPAVLESIGRVAAGCTYLLPFPSAFCLYDTFDPADANDENYQNAESFRNAAKHHSPGLAGYIDEIWTLFEAKRQQFRSVHSTLPRASFQSDLNKSNILVDDNMAFAGYIDFNLSGSETVLGYIITNEVCGYRLKKLDLDSLADANFRRSCDDYLYKNLAIIGKHYSFTPYEQANLCLCYNTVYPFSCWSANFMLDTAIKQSKLINPVLDWVYWQLSRDDIRF